MNKKYVPVSSISYSGNNPETPEFQEPWAHARTVHQGFGGISTGKPLLSEGFARCSAILILNLDTNSTLLAHLDGDCLSEIGDGVFPLKTERYDVFLREPGEKIALPINGTVTFRRDGIDAQMREDDITVLPPLDLETGEMHWSVLYRPGTRELLIDNRHTRQLVLFRPFPAPDMERIRKANVVRPLDEQVDEADRLKDFFKKAVRKVHKAVLERDAALLRKTMENMTPAELTGLEERFSKQYHDSPLSLLFSQYAGRARETPEAGLVMLSMISTFASFASNEDTKSHCILRLCELSDDMSIPRGNPPTAGHLRVARQSIGRALELYSSLSEGFKSSRPGEFTRQYMESASRRQAENSFSLPAPGAT